MGTPHGESGGRRAKRLVIYQGITFALRRGLDLVATAHFTRSIATKTVTANKDHNNPHKKDSSTDQYRMQIKREHARGWLTDVSLSVCQVLDPLRPLTRQPHYTQHPGFRHQLRRTPSDRQRKKDRTEDFSRSHFIGEPLGWQSDDGEGQGASFCSGLYSLEGNVSSRDWLQTARHKQSPRDWLETVWMTRMRNLGIAITPRHCLIWGCLPQSAQGAGAILQWRFIPAPCMRSCSWRGYYTLHPFLSVSAVSQGPKEENLSSTKHSPPECFTSTQTQNGKVK